jgi:hypothetical protein
MATSVAEGTETLVVQATNMVTNGEFDTDTAWTKGTNWSISSNVATNTGTTSDLVTSTALSPSLVLGDWYYLEYAVTAYTSGSIAADLGGGPSSVSRDATGRYVEALQAGSGSDLTFSSTSFNGSIDGVRLRQIGQVVHTTTTSGTYQLFLNLENMVGDDEVLAMVGTQIGSSPGKFCWNQYATFRGPQGELSGPASIPLPSAHEYKAAIIQLAGTAIDVDWEVIKL